MLEGANGPTTYLGEEILNKRGIVVVPDILCSSGGVIVSYFEWHKNLKHVAPGRLTKRHQEKKDRMIIQMLGIKLDSEETI